MENTTLTFEQALENFLNLTKEASDKYFNDHYPKNTKPVFEALEGVKNIKVVRFDNGIVRKGFGSAHLFIDKATGDILKAASYKAPAKGARGNIYNEDPLKGTGPHGADYNNGWSSAKFN